MNLKYKTILSATAALMAITGSAGAKSKEKVNQVTADGYSFAVFGDSRSMLHLPDKANEKEEATKLIVDMFNLVLPEKMAEELVRKDVKLTYDPKSGELVQIVMPFMTASEVMTLTIDKGWVIEASVEDTKLLPGVRRTIFRLPAGQWISREIVRDVQTGRTNFIVNTGDIVWWGKQGNPPSKNPYWKLVDEEVLQKLPPPDEKMVAAGLPGRIFPAVGNHEIWDDSDVEGLLSAFPYLKKFGVSNKRLIYKIDYQDTRFIFLWTGKYDYREPSGWGATRPAFEEQMSELKTWLDEAKANGTRKVFVSFHAPAFCSSGMGPIPEAQNPHKVLASYAKDMEIVVFNGHVHTTEVYEVDGIKYLVLGGGGAEQDPILPGRSHFKVPADYPPEQYWKGEDRKEEYNYLTVDVKPGQKTKFTLNRLRPWSSQPFATVELFKSSK